MQYPFRVKVEFNKNQPKLATIQKLNHFLNHDAVGKWERYNIMRTVDYDRVFTGIELAFADQRDAVHFKLGFNNDESI